jgi:hypothetical protein
VKFLAAITAASRIKAKLAALAAGFTAQKPPRARFCVKFAIFLAQVKGTVTRESGWPSFVYCPGAAGYLLTALGGDACRMVPACSDKPKKHQDGTYPRRIIVYRNKIAAFLKCRAAERRPSWDNGRAQGGFEIHPWRDGRRDRGEARCRFPSIDRCALFGTGGASKLPSG